MGGLLLLRFVGEGAARCGSSPVPLGSPLSPTTAQAGRVWLPAVSRQRCVRETGCTLARLLSPTRACACLHVKPVREPDDRNGHVRFDERGGETERCASRRERQRKTPLAVGAAGPARHRASPRLYH